MTAMSTQVEGEERTLLRDVSPETYESILDDFADRSAPRFTYDRGELEIMTPHIQHERYARAIDQVVTLLSLETGRNVSVFGSSTYRRGKSHGFESDGSYYVGSPAPREKRSADLSVVPPPDIVVEIEMTNPLLDKKALLSHLQIREIWRYDGARVEILVLGLETQREYAMAPISHALPVVSAEDLTQLLHDFDQLQETAWLRVVRDWAGGLAGTV